MGGGGSTPSPQHPGKENFDQKIGTPGNMERPIGGGGLTPHFTTHEVSGIPVQPWVITITRSLFGGLGFNPHPNEYMGAHFPGMQFQIAGGAHFLGHCIIRATPEMLQGINTQLFRLFPSFFFGDISIAISLLGPGLCWKKTGSSKNPF